MAGIRLQMPLWDIEAKTGFREGVRFGWEAEEDLNREGKFSDESNSPWKNPSMAGAMKRPPSRVRETGDNTVYLSGPNGEPLPMRMGSLAWYYKQ